MRLLRALGAVLVLAGLLLAVTATATAQTVISPLPLLVTDYANYPDTPGALLGPACDFQGVNDTEFSLNGAPAVGSLLDFPGELQLGDVVTMTWGSVDEACVGSAISLVVKVASNPFFDVNDDQETGPDGGYIVATLDDAGPGSLTITMPDLARFGLGCNYQLDAIVGVPLQDVGPSGSYFTGLIRLQQGKGGPDLRTTLLSARNGVYTVCTPTTTTTTTTTTTSTSTTDPTPSSTTQPPPSSSTTAAGQIAQTAQRTLAATGTTPWTALAGIVAVGFGVLLLVAGRRRDVAPRRSS